MYRYLGIYYKLNALSLDAVIETIKKYLGNWYLRIILDKLLT